MRLDGKGEKFITFFTSPSGWYAITSSCWANNKSLLFCSDMLLGLQHSSSHVINRRMSIAAKLLLAAIG